MLEENAARARLRCVHTGQQQAVFCLECGPCPFTPGGTPGRRFLSKTAAGKVVAGILNERSHQNAAAEKQLQKVKRRQFFPCFSRRSFNSLSEMLLLPDWSILDSRTSISTSLPSFSMYLAFRKPYFMGQ
jgi:hypothetical protein